MTDDTQQDPGLSSRLLVATSSHGIFRALAARTAHGVGSPWAFAGALMIVLMWGLTGSLFHFSDTWQLVINTGTTIVTFLMVFLIQNTQNRDSQAIHLKLDELIRVNVEARNRLMQLDDLSDEELSALQGEFSVLARKRRAEGERSARGARAPRPERFEPSTAGLGGLAHRVRDGAVP